MKSLTLWKTDTQWLYVRFSRVGNRTNFNNILAHFRKEFPNAEWTSSRTWRMPMSNMQRLMLFSTLHFGVDSVAYIDDNAIPKQLPLFKYNQENA